MNNQTLVFENFNDDNGNPAGGYASSVGLIIQWQEGPLGRGDDRQEPNGAFVETVIRAALQRLEYYQDSGFACDENAEAASNLRVALECLSDRTRRREEEDVEGTHEGN